MCRALTCALVGRCLEPNTMSFEELLEADRPKRENIRERRSSVPDAGANCKAQAVLAPVVSAPWAKLSRHLGR